MCLYIPIYVCKHRVYFVNINSSIKYIYFATVDNGDRVHNFYLPVSVKAVISLNSNSGIVV